MNLVVSEGVVDQVSERSSFERKMRDFSRDPRLRDAGKGAKRKVRSQISAVTFS